MNDLMIDYFMAVATNLSFTKTSKELFVSQPAISKQITQLEKELGARLFSRNNKETQLTEVGRLYFDFFSRYKSDFMSTKIEADRILGKKKGIIRVGFLEGWDLFNIIPPMMKQFKECYPDSDIIINVNGTYYKAYHTGECGYSLYLKKEDVTFPAVVYVNVTGMATNPLEKKTFLIDNVQ